ncbi:titin homolog [Pectinophora gossypiella]|nr:titin homolog [Pectinophora gossypiella]
MSIFNELLPKLIDISDNSAKSFVDELQAALECLDKFEEEYQNGRGNARDRAQKDKTLMTTLQSIHEDDDESNKTPESDKSTKSNDDDKTKETNGKRRVSKKRSKDEVEGLSSPELDKRQKRNASVKAQSIISKQVNVNLTQKLRRENSAEKKSRRRKDGEDKENDEPAVPVIQIKQEKVSLPPEPMDTESLPLNIDIKQEPDKDEVAMPPPVAPVPKPRKALQKEKDREESVEEESGSKRRNTRTRKQTDADTMPPPVAPVPSARATRASSRATKQLDVEDMPPPEARPKRTRAKKKVSEASSTEAEKTQTLEESGLASPAEKPRPKRTRRGKNAEKEAQKVEEQQKEIQEINTTTQISTKEERISQPDSPVLQKPKNNKKTQKTDDDNKKTKQQTLKEKEQTLKEKQQTLKEKQQNSKRQSSNDNVDGKPNTLNETQVITQNMNVTVTLNNDMDKTMVLPNGVYSHAPVTPQSIRVNETMVIEACTRETMVIEKANINDATVVIEKEAKPANMTDDNSLLTDDGSESEVHTPPKPVPQTQATSAVKEKVQQFEELAARTTRTKTRAMAKIEDQDNVTPPDKMIKPVLSQETLNKMNNMIFNGKPPQVSSSASKPRAIPVPKAHQPASTSKLSALSRHKEAAEESLKKEKEDARKKKEAMLEAKRELQKKKREEKMANAAAAREAAERERRLAMEAAAKDRMEKQLHADQGKLERLKEVERKKQELARKVAETEERRRAEEQARHARLAEEQKKADAARRKQLEEAEAMKKEAALMAKEIEKRQKEYMEKQKMKHMSDKLHTPLKTPGTPGYYPMEPVYMCDGFQYLNSDEDEEPVQRPVPAWSSSKARKLALVAQSSVPPQHIDALFSVRVHSPDLREIFPNIERARLKRTSSAVWRTPPRLPPLAE